MCFSATASFTVAAVAGVAGVLAISRASDWRDVPFASFPLLFGAQQAMEGAQWLAIGPDGAGEQVDALRIGFLLFAEVLWPVYAPLAAMLIEPRARRRVILGAFAVLALPLAAYLAYTIFTHSNVVALHDGSIRYVEGFRRVRLLGLAYLFAAAFPLLLSSHRAVIVFGVAVTASFSIAGELYRETFISIWCFFAAAASLIVLFHFFGAERRTVVSRP